MSEEQPEKTVRVPVVLGSDLTFWPMEDSVAGDETVEVPEGTLRRWREAETAWKAAQDEIEGLFEAAVLARRADALTQIDT